MWILESKKIYVVVPEPQRESGISWSASHKFLDRIMKFKNSSNKYQYFIHILVISYKQIKIKNVFVTNTFNAMDEIYS